MTEFIIGQIVGFSVGLLSSFIFWYYLLALKPRLELPPVITYSPTDYKFRLKFGNKGRRQIVDVEVGFALMERLPPQDKEEPGIGRKFIKRRYELNRQTISAIESKQHHKEWDLPIRMTLSTVPTDEDIDLNLDDLFIPSASSGERRLVITVSATDALSGTKFVQRVSYPREKVVYGRFGMRYELVEEIPTYLPQPAEPQVQTQQKQPRSLAASANDFDTLASELSQALERLETDVYADSDARAEAPNAEAASQPRRAALTDRATH